MQLHIYGPQARHAITCDIADSNVLLGRAQSCDVQLPFKVVSSRHMQIQQNEQSQYVLTDLGSTNGTILNGEHLSPNQPYVLEHDASIEILDLRIVVDLSKRRHEGFTLAERETFVRQMVSQALLEEQGKDDLAFFEIVRGAKRGQRITLLDTVQEAWVGSAPDALWQIGPGSPQRAAKIMRQGDGFVIIPQQGQVCIDGQPITQSTRLSSRQRLLVAQDESIFFDPLQEYLDGLEGLPQEEPAGEQAHTLPPPADPLTSTAPVTQQALSTPSPAQSARPLDIPDTAPPQSVAPAPTNPAHQKQRWSAVELLILLMTIIFVIGGIVVMLFVLGII